PGRARIRRESRRQRSRSAGQGHGRKVRRVPRWRRRGLSRAVNAPLLTWIARARRTPSAVLLAVQLLGIVLYPWMEQLAAGRALLNASGLVVLGAALWMVRRSPFANRVAALLAVLVVMLYALQA